MATPRKGDYESLPLNANGRRVADAWNLEADNAAGMQCKAFGVGGVIRQPGRLHITWADDDTLSVDFDAGTQTRLLEFASTAQQSGEKTWQGFSRAQWQHPPQSGGGPQSRADRQQHGPDRAGRRRSRSARRPRALAGADGGRLAQSRRRRISARAICARTACRTARPPSITEYFHRLPDAPNGDVWLHVVTIVEDPALLERAALHEHAVQARNERREVDSDTMPHRATAGRAASGRASRRAVAALTLRATYEARFRGSVAARFRCEIAPRRDFPVSSLRAGGASGEALRSRSESR